MRNTSTCIVAACLFTGALAPAARAADDNVVNARGQRLAVQVDWPSGDSKVPAVVLAPGQGYHMALPAMEALSRALTQQGVAVFRFNWAYFSAEPKGQPSDDLSRELQDLQAVVAAARRHPRVVPENLTVAGKSLGSVVAWQALAADAKLRGALLLTPICSRVPKGDTVPRDETSENYPQFAQERRPTLWVAGDRDPLCATSVLYRFAGAQAQTARVAVVGGDHSFEQRTGSSAEAALKRNLAAVSAVSAGFVAELAGP
ncbi:MAG: alpha/beta fold hydrolase [Rubrivivax sp.]|nr:alpha/beta fold hydrolase [Rubrivivax sp.]